MHKYEQYFVDNIERIYNFDEISKGRNMKEIFNILNGDEYFSDPFYEAIKILDLKSASNN